MSDELVNKNQTSELKIHVNELAKRETMWPAFHALVKSGESSVPVLIKALKEDDDIVRAVSAVVLGEIGPIADQAIPDLIQLLHDNNKEARMSAALALIKIGNEAVQALEQCLQSDNPLAKFWAAWALIMNDSSKMEAVPILKEAWETSKDKYVTLAAAEGLSKAMKWRIDELKE
ncbi:HEAT repeat domain-containing protein [Paenibacillus zeisoli]|nr:HEAT repeat domain-containing protein [Paenibacillus zeisoli]